MRVLRSSLFVAATAIIAAACGDKVNIVQPTTAAGAINSVQIAPASATISVGQSVQLTAAVNASTGITPTITWSTSSSAAATVSQTGLVTGIAASPGVAICAAAASSGVATVTACGTVIVQPIATITPATVQITSITGANLNTPVAVPPGVVAGQINVSVTANPGTSKLDSVVVFLNGKSAGTQTFSAAQAAALRSAANAAVADQQVLAPLVFSINTGAFNATTGAVTYPNGITSVSAVAYGHQGASASTNTASQSVSLLLGNADAWAVTQTLGSTTNANNAAGFTFTTGSVTVAAVPVMYSGSTIASANVNFGTAACDLSGGPQRTQALTAPAAGTFAWTATFAKTSATTAGTAADVNSYEYNTACASNAGGGEGITIASSNLTGNATGPTGIAAGITIPVTRLDNRAPAAPVVLAGLNANGRTNQWFNDTVSLNTVQSASNLNGMINAAVVDAGVGGVKYAARAGTTLALANAASDITTPASLAMLATNTSYCLTQYSVDALGNRSANPAACAMTFGVDRIPPLVSYDATSLGANARQFGGSIGGEFVLTVSDTGLVGNSGMAPGTPVTMQLTRVIKAATNGVGVTSARNADGSAATTAGVQTATGVGGVLPLKATTITASTQAGYYTLAATAFDAAGNSTVVPARTILYDAPAPVVGAASTPISVTALGWTANAFVNDALDIQTQWFSGDYAALPAPFAVGTNANPSRFAQAQTQLNGFNPAASFNNTNYALSQGINLPFEMQTGMAATLAPITGVEANAINQGNLISSGAAAAAPVFTAPTAITVAPMATWGPITNSIASNNISSGVTTAATAGNPASGTLSVTATGPTATFNNPFSRVDFYAVNNGGAAGTEYRLIGSTTALSLVDNGGTRTLTWSLPVSGATLYTTLSFTATAATNVVAIGYNAAGTVGMFTAAQYALTIIK